MQTLLYIVPKQRSKKSRTRVVASPASFAWFEVLLLILMALLATLALLLTGAASLGAGFMFGATALTASGAALLALAALVAATGRFGPPVRRIVSIRR